jgi:hypothetical protein
VSDLKEEPAGTNLLGLVKHLAGLEYGYLGESLGFPAPESMSWIEDGSIWQGADMWAGGGPDQETFDEPTWREYIAQVQAAASTFVVGREAPPQS